MDLIAIRKIIFALYINSTTAHLFSYPAVSTVFAVKNHLSNNRVFATRKTYE